MGRMKGAFAGVDTTQGLKSGRKGIRRYLAPLQCSNGRGLRRLRTRPPAQPPPLRPSPARPLAPAQDLACLPAYPAAWLGCLESCSSAVPSHFRSRLPHMSEKGAPRCLVSPETGRPETGRPASAEGRDWHARCRASVRTLGVGWGGRLGLCPILLAWTPLPLTAGLLGSLAALRRK